MVDNENELKKPLEAIEEYQKTRSKELCASLVLHYGYIAKSVAVQMRGIISGYAQVEDVVNEGVLTLMDCFEKYSPEKGMKFENYAFMRIRNANIDFIRKQDWVPRRVRRTAREVSEAYNQLSTEIMREPTNKELAAHMKISDEQLRKHYTEMNSGAVISFEELLQSSLTGEPEPLSLSFGNVHEALPEKGLMKKEMQEQLAQAINNLTEKERMVVSLYYYEHLKLHEIADIMGVSESRISQTHSKSIMKMKKGLLNYLNI